MNLKLRRSLYGMAFVLFAIIGPVLTLYAAGYRFDAGQRSFIKVGAFYIKSYPSGAEIFIDELSRENTTPARLLNLKPRKYSIRVQKAGFQSWEKQLAISSGETNFVRDIVLFNSNIEAERLSVGGTEFIKSPDATQYLFLDSNQILHLTNVESTKDFEIRTIPKPHKIFALSPSKTEVLLGSNELVYVLDLNTEQVTPLRTLTMSTISKINWDELNPSLLWLIRNDTLVAFNLVSGEQRILDSGVKDFYPVAASIIVILQVGDEIHLRSISSATREVQWDVIIDTDQAPQIKEIHDGQIITLLGSNGIWVVDMLDASKSPVFFHAKLFSWHDKKLLMANDFEISNYHFPSKELHLIDRASAGISLIQWHPSGSYFLRKAGDAYEILELDGRDVRNRITVSLPENLRNVVFSAKGDVLYTLSEESNMFYRIQDL